MAQPTTLTVERLRRLIHRSPRYIAGRVVGSLERRARRPWSILYPRLVTERAFLAALGARDIDDLWTGLMSRPFFIAASSRGEAARRFQEAYPGQRDAIVGAAGTILNHEFDLLGSGLSQLGPRLPWDTDFKTGRRWPLEYFADIEYNELDRPSDVKVPWELSRCQHFSRLGQAYWLTGDEKYAREFVAEAEDWMTTNPFARGVNWACAMDVALRAVSWIWGFHFFAAADACRGRAFRSRFLRSLFLHGAFVSAHLEKADLNGNHYLADGVGLVFLGCLFARSRAGARWQSLGRDIVEHEILTQTTADGVDFEQSTAYHRLVLEAFLTSYVLLRLNGQNPPEPCWNRLERMCEFVAAYTKPDGRAPLIGDADDGRIQILGMQDTNDHRYLLSSAAVLFERGGLKQAAGRCWEETFWLLGASACDRFRELSPAGVAAPSSVAFPESGFYVLRTAQAHLIVDCGEVGFGGRGGHGHNDILSFELFLNGFNVITDCGAYLYTASREWRDLFRSTSFHNTVQVDGEELNRFIAPDALWQLRYDAKPIDAAIERGERADCFRGSHSGYERLADPVTHMRRIAVDRERPVVFVCDRMSGRGQHRLIWRFHFDPAVRVEMDGQDICVSAGGAVGPGSPTVWLMPGAGATLFTQSIEDGWVSPRYGVKVPVKVAVWQGVATTPMEATFVIAAERLPFEERACVRFC